MYTIQYKILYFTTTVKNDFVRDDDDDDDYDRQIDRNGGHARQHDAHARHGIRRYTACRPADGSRQSRIAIITVAAARASSVVGRRARTADDDRLVGESL